MRRFALALNAAALLLGLGCEPSEAASAVQPSDLGIPLTSSMPTGQAPPALTATSPNAKQTGQKQHRKSAQLPRKSVGKIKKQARKSKTSSAVPTGDHKIGTIGAVEQVYVEQLAELFLARIDTGAATSSIDAQDITAFERDGEEWVRFSTSPRPNRPFEPAEDKWPDGERPELLVTELPVVDQVIIESGAKDQKRYVVKLGIVMGKFPISGRFTLNDRAQLNYGVLIGRNLLAGNAVVDVSQTKVQGRPKVERQESEPLPLTTNNSTAGAQLKR